MDQIEEASAEITNTRTDFGEIDVLVVDDSRFMLKVVEDALRQLGVGAIRCADSGAGALDAIRERAPHLMLVDLHMPGMDGVETIAGIAAIGCRPSIVLMTAAERSIVNSVSDIVREYGMPLIGHLPKRFRPANVERLLYLHLERQGEVSRKDNACLGADDVRAAFSDNRLVLYYQPRVGLSDRHLLGVECLARIEHESQGVLPPSSFLPTVLSAGLTEEFDRRVVEMSLGWLKNWSDLGVEITLNFNVFIDTLYESWLHDLLVETTQTLELKPKNVTVEVAETQLITDVRASLETLSRIRLKGFGVSIDDFGVGASNLQQLRRLPCSEIKIDRSFVAGAHGDDQARMILESSTSLGRRLGLHVVAEGVETQEEWDLVKELGCDSVQGYFVARPMTAEAFTEWMARNWRE